MLTCLFICLLICLFIYLDFGATLHVFNDLFKFLDFRKSTVLTYIQAESSTIPILGYGAVRVFILHEDRSEGVLRLKNVTFWVDFVSETFYIRRLATNEHHNLLKSPSQNI